MLPHLLHAVSHAGAKPLYERAELVSGDVAAVSRIKRALQVPLLLIPQLPVQVSRECSLKLVPLHHVLRRTVSRR